MFDNALLNNFLDVSNSEFEEWDRFYHVVYLSGTPEDFSFCVVKGSK